MNEELQKKYLEIQSLNEEAKQIQQSLMIFEQHFLELKNLEESLGDINKSKDKEVFVLLGNGIYSKANLLGNNVLVNVGGNVFVIKDIAEAKEFVANQSEEIIAKIGELQRELNNIITEAGKIQNSV